MRYRTLLPLIFSFAAAGCGDSSLQERRKAAERLLRSDLLVLDNPDSVQQVVERMRSVPLRDCPEDLKLAYQRHIADWEALAEIESRVASLNPPLSDSPPSPQQFTDGSVLEQLSTLAGSRAELAPLESDLRQAALSINASYEAVESVAYQHIQAAP